MQLQDLSADSHAQLRDLYRALLENEEHYHEFKQRLAAYPLAEGEVTEPDEAARLREQLNSRIRTWVAGDFEGLTAMQVTLWRSIIIEERFNVALSPWKEANWY
jgi:hypothetical protein